MTFSPEECREIRVDSGVEARELLEWNGGVFLPTDLLDKVDDLSLDYFRSTEKQSAAALRCAAPHHAVSPSPGRTLDAVKFFIKLEYATSSTRSSNLLQKHLQPRGRPK